jgi:uncharacterized iron-regulated membrane protein
MPMWQRWLQHPQNTLFYRTFFQIHFIVGAMVGIYIMLMSLTGSVIVFRNELSRHMSVEWIVNLHKNLLAGQIGSVANGIGASLLTVLCLTGAIIWWPGIKNWRRSLTVNWRANLGRISWDLHSAVGFWCYIFILIWSVSGIYFSFPRPFNTFFHFIDPQDKFSDSVLAALSDLHFGRFNLITEVLWSFIGLAPAVLSATGVFVCCRRVMFNKNSNPHQSDAV